MNRRDMNKVKSKRLSSALHTYKYDYRGVAISFWNFQTTVYSFWQNVTLLSTNSSNNINESLKSHWHNIKMQYKNNM